MVRKQQKTGKQVEKKSEMQRKFKMHKSSSTEEQTRTRKSLKTEKNSGIKYKLLVGVVVCAMYMMVFGWVAWRGATEAQKFWSGQEEAYVTVRETLSRIYDDVEGEIPLKTVDRTAVEDLRTAVVALKVARYDDEKAEIERRIQELDKFIGIREEIAQYLKDGVAKVDTKLDDLEATKEKLAELPESYRKVLQSDYDVVRNQFQEMQSLEQAVAEMFTDATMKTVAPRLTRAAYRAVVERVNKLPQRELAAKYTDILKRVDQVLVQREKEAAEARRRALEAQRRAAELRKKQKAEEVAAWRVLNVPYHSQNLQKIYNGCEAASMLMGLQYKGYLGGVDLHKYAEMMPKSDDYNTGFVGSIYDLQPKTYVHWIAPAPLAKFGRESSGNANVVDVSGVSLSDLDKEVLAGNPVVIYVTFLFNAPKPWANGAPGNLHVVLLTGYNEKTGAQRLTDPWTQAGGGRTYDLSKAELEKIYNAVGKRAVVIR